MQFLARQRCEKRLLAPFVRIYRRREDDTALSIMKCLARYGQYQTIVAVNSVHILISRTRPNKLWNSF